MASVTDSNCRTYIRHSNGQRTHYILDDFTDPWLASSTETILIQHGFGRHASHWYHWIPILSCKYRVIRRDLRGHGYSSYPISTDPKPYDYSIETIVDEIIDTLDQLEVERVHFLGESTSGMLGEILAAKHPDRLFSLTICSSPTYLPSAALKLFAFDHPDWPTACRELGSRGWAEALSQVPGTVSIPDLEYVKWWIDQVAVSDGEGLAGYADFLSRLDSRPYLKDITVPMLILAPAGSAAVKVEDMRELQRQVQGAQLVVIDGGGHEIYVGAAGQCQKAILEFFDKLKDKRRHSEAVCFSRS